MDRQPRRSKTEWREIARRALSNLAYVAFDDPELKQVKEQLESVRDYQAEDHNAALISVDRQLTDIIERYEASPELESSGLRSTTLWVAIAYGITSALLSIEAYSRRRRKHELHPR